MSHLKWKQIFFRNQNAYQDQGNSGNKYKGLQKVIENAYYRENYTYIFNIFAPK